MKRLTETEVRGRLKRIRAVAWDPEVAHGLEDALLRDALKAIAQGRHPASAAKLARLVLNTYRIKFARWAA